MSGGVVQSNSSGKLKWIIGVLAIVVVLLLVYVVLHTFNSSGVARNSLPPRNTKTSNSPSVQNTPQNKTNSSQSNASVASPVSVSSSNFDLQKIPLGDGNVSTSPKVGYVYSCQQSFKSGGASHTGDWIHGNTWNLSQKIHVEGSVSWSNAKLSIRIVGNKRVIIGNGLPVNETTGIYPIQPTDPAYQIDKNPNSIEPHNISFSIPLNPQFAASPSCVPMGIVGIALDGVPIYNALDAAGRDAVAHEVQDSCNGHPDSSGTYHYHGPSPCIPGENKSSTLIGYALDGFGIYSPYSANGSLITDAQLDACHGINSTVMWNGKMQKVYHYVLTEEYPYTIGCFRGTPIRYSIGVHNPRTPPGA